MSKSLSKRTAADKKSTKKRDWNRYKAMAAAQKLKEDSLVVHQTRLMKDGMNAFT